MKYFLSLLLIISFIALSIFGSLIIGHNMGHPVSSCLVAVSDGGSCPVGVINFILHHNLILKIFSKILVSSNFMVLVILLSLFSIFVLFWQKILFHSDFKFLLSKSHSLISDHYFSRKKIISWLALFEQSPNL
ncbi:MAG: hypothetical protein COU81_00140 [Candidatus Portnoybacteria bacterium CG10_big_fil_rev_8_21_14_0_10_36_7]|uniref:Uncharacterized protein n=1 Tax=Candidatus Portnoybacteria bacterium CG10_big_fil_rev_8_21_14_0_10_36_7 TaxID=1974812 RepID=A0A2M8KF41_9BACT|nr:MAG: hypothetical protein COU81_00140 [Candidatus Portnoybacteria bacterium CG10_big_fil_rev_8_21_14_0_10_36_7]